MADFPQEEASWLPGAEQFSALKSQWDSFLEQPGGRTALLQFGINMMQPPSFGDTPMSQVGRALGAAGEATTRQQEIERRERESEDKSEIGFMRAEAAQQRAGRQQDRAGFEQERLGIKRQQVEDAKERSRLQLQFDSMRLYQDYVKATKAHDAKKRAIWENSVGAYTGKTQPPPETPIMGPEEFAATRGLPAPAVRSTTPSSAPTASPTLEGRPPPPGGTIEPPKGRPRAVNRKTNEVMEWDGTNWVLVK